MVRKPVLTVWALSWLAIPAVAQHAQFQLYGQEQGLENLAVQGVAVDEQGFLWAATEAGVYRWDGTRFIHIGAEAGVSEGPFSRLFVGSTGHLWTLAAQSLFYEDGGRFRRIGVQGLVETTKMSTLIPELGDGEMAVVSGGRLSSIRQRRDARGRMEWAAEDFSEAHPGFPKALQIHSLVQTRAGAWMGCDDGICHWLAGKLVRLGEDRGIPRDTYREFLEMRSGEVWARGRKHLLRLAPGSGEWTNGLGELAKHEIDYQFALLAEDHQGRLLAALGKDLAIRDAAGWHVYGAREGMPGSDISAIYADGGGGLWLGLQGGGLARWEGYGTWRNYTEAEGLPSHTVWGLTPDGAGGLIAGTESGVAHLPLGATRFQPLAGAEKLRCTLYDLARTPDGSLWLPCGMTLYRQFPGERRMQRYPMPAISADLIVAGNDLWVATMNSLFVIHSDRRNATLEPFSPLGVREVRQMALGRAGELWVSNSDGLYRVDLVHLTATLAAPAATLSRTFSLAMDREGVLWVAKAQGGIERLRVEGAALKTIDRIARPTLRSRQIYQILVDRRGWLWLSGDSGLDVWHDGRWSSLNDKNGLVWNDTDYNSLLEDTDGSIWVGTSGGLSHLLAPEKALEVRPLAVHIASITVGGRELLLTSPVKIPPGKGVIEIRLATSEHEGDPHLRLKYNSPGYLDGWTDLGENLIRMAQSTPRHALLEFQLFDDHGTAYSPMTTLDVEVFPPWWRSQIAFALYALVLACLLWLGWRLRTHQMRVNQHRLEKLVAVRTREIAEKNRVLEAIQLQLRHKATHDALTGLHNRDAVLEILVREIGRCRREGRPLVAAIFDLDHFKEINDNFGHPVGDDVLVGVAHCLRGALRDYDVSGRFGGEEFVVLLPGLGEADAGMRLDAIREEISRQVFHAEGAQVKASASFGYAILGPEDTVRSLMARADKALYRAKAEGRNRVFFEAE